MCINTSVLSYVLSSCPDESEQASTHLPIFGMYQHLCHAMLCYPILSSTHNKHNSKHLANMEVYPGICQDTCHIPYHPICVNTSKMHLDIHLSRHLWGPPCHLIHVVASCSLIWMHMNTHLYSSNIGMEVLRHVKTPMPPLLSHPAHSSRNIQTLIWTLTTCWENPLSLHLDASQPTSRHSPSCPDTSNMPPDIHPTCLNTCEVNCLILPCCKDASQYSSNYWKCLNTCQDIYPVVLHPILSSIPSCTIPCHATLSSGSIKTCVHTLIK